MDKRCAFEHNEFVCKILSKKECEGCRFFKTEEELATGRERAEKRLRQFPLEKQLHYDGMYHNQYMKKF